eukprot:1179255-Rhodomonas_salina.1
MLAGGGNPKARSERDRRPRDEDGAVTLRVTSRFAPGQNRDSEERRVPRSGEHAQVEAGGNDGDAVPHVESSGAACSGADAQVEGRSRRSKDGAG